MYMYIWSNFFLKINKILNNKNKKKIKKKKKYIMGKLHGTLAKAGKVKK